MATPPPAHSGPCQNYFTIQLSGSDPPQIGSSLRLRVPSLPLFPFRGFHGGASANQLNRMASRASRNVSWNSSNDCQTACPPPVVALISSGDLITWTDRIPEGLFAILRFDHRCGIYHVDRFAIYGVELRFTYLADHRFYTNCHSITQRIRGEVLPKCFELHVLISDFGPDV